ncbi:MAG: hypothetical protein LBC02_07790 [Planctomycetaceae bacterium]|jgi:hypothetical protein|nr:hypothetical protein [Planctomycetaceae bacterium]
MFLKGSTVWVQKNGDLWETRIQEVQVGDLVFTEKCRFRPVVETHVQAMLYGSLRCENGWKIWCFYHAPFFGYTKPKGEPEVVFASDMSHGYYWKRYSDCVPDEVDFEKVTDWRPAYNHNPFAKKKNGLPPLDLENAYSLVVEEDHSFWLNNVAVFDDTYDKGFVEFG